MQTRFHPWKVYTYTVYTHISKYFRTFLNAETKLDQLPSAKVSGESYTDKELYCETFDASSQRRTAERHCKKCDVAFCKEHLKVILYLARKQQT